MACGAAAEQAAVETAAGHEAAATTVKKAKANMRKRLQKQKKRAVGFE